MPPAEPTPGDGTQLGSEVLPAFPPELERKIFLLTAQAYRGVSIRLMLVASRVRTWIEPFVYKTIILRGPERAASFLGALTDYRLPEFARSHVKALCILPSIPFGLVVQILTTCSGIESLALWTPPHSETGDLIDLLSSLRLTFLSINLVSIQLPGYPTPILQDHPAFVNLTHLDIVNNWVLWTSSLGIELLPRLTHVSLRFWSRGSVNSALSMILQESHHLQVLVLFAHSVVLSASRVYLEKQGVQDIRVVVLRHSRDADEWELMERESMSMWERAEYIVRWRRVNGAGPFDFPPGFSFGSTENASHSTS